MAISSPFLGGAEKKQWWLTNKMIAEKYVKDAKCLIGTGAQNDIVSALNLLDAALILSPRYERALELKARSLLYLRRYREVADMLQDYIPSLKMASSDESSFENSSQQLSREQVKLLSSSESQNRDSHFRCFSVSELRKKIMAGLCKSCDNQTQWRYVVLGQASCHLGLLEDAMVLLQTGKRLANAALRRESTCWSDDGFTISDFPPSDSNSPEALSQPETIANLLTYVKLLIRRRTAALAALDAGLYSEAIRHFTKIVDGRRGAPQGFLAECYMYRSSAYRSVGRIADSISDCNRTLALDPTCIQALETRASLYETIRCLPDSLHDLEHLKLLYNSILRDRKLPGPAWKRHNVRYREIPGKLCEITTKIEKLKQRVASGETGNVDYFNLIGLRRGCSRSELERAYLLLCLRHKPEKATNFIDRCEVSDDGGLDSIRDKAKMSALMLYRLLQKGYSSVMTAIMEEEAAEKKRKNAAAAVLKQSQEMIQELETKSMEISNPNTIQNQSSYQGVFCRDIVVVGNLLSQVGFGRPIAVKYEALSC